MVRFATEMRSPESRPGHRPGRTFEEELNLRYLSPGAFTVLGPEDRGLPPEPPQAPTVFRLSPNSRRHRNQAFSIIAEPLSGRSRSPSPTSGRVSPFRGRGFNPTGSRHTSPAPSPPPDDNNRLNNNNHYPTNNNPNRPTVVSRKSQIPQLKRRDSASILFTEENDGSPKYRRKNATNLKPQLSKSLNYIGPKNNNVSTKPPPNPGRKYPGLTSRGGTGFSRLSPIIGSSPEPSSDNKSLSSPSSRNHPKSRSTPPSRKHSPNREESLDYQLSSSREESPDYHRGSVNAKRKPDGVRGSNRSKVGSPEYYNSQRGKGRSREHSPEKGRGSKSRDHSPEYERGKGSKGRVSTSREHSPDYHQKGKSREHSPEHHQKGKSREHSPDHHQKGKGREHSPDHHLKGKGREHSPDYHQKGKGKVSSSRENSPDYHRRTKGKVSSSREPSPDYQKGKHGREHSPDYHRGKGGREHSPDYENGEHSPDHQRRKPAGSPGHPSKSRVHSPDYESETPQSSSRGKTSSSPEQSSRGKTSSSREGSPEHRNKVGSPMRGSRVNSRAGSRNPSRNVSREPSPSSKPPFSPTRIPVRNYKNVQSKVNSYAKTTTKAPARKTQDAKEVVTKDSKGKTGLSRTDSVSKIVSKPSKFGGSGSNLSKTSGSTSNLSKTQPKTSGSQSNLNRSSVRTNPANSSNSNNNKKPPSSGVKGDVSSASKVSAKPPAKGPKTSILKSSQEPGSATIVSATTATVTHPLKIEAKLEADGDKMTMEKPKPKQTPMYMDEDSQTLLKDHNMSKLSPAASAIITLSNDNNSATTTLPNVETVANRIDTASQNVNNSVSNISNNVKGVENNVKNNINKLISPDDSFGAKVNSYENSANDRMKEARTMVASDVKPIRITVQEKPNDVEVQSGNVRFPPNATNGVASGPGGAPPQGENGNNRQQPEPPKSRCQMMMERCRNKMPCSCCKPKEKKVDDGPKESKGCFSCCKKKKKIEVEQVIVSSPEEVENAKKTFMERLKCCRSNKVADSTTGCCGRGKRKDSWEVRRDSILSAPIPVSRGTKCKNFFKKIFCCCGCACCIKKVQQPKMLEETSASRRASMLSKKKSLTPTVLPPEEPKNKLDTSLVEYSSSMKAAIPVLPIALAYICLFFNVFAPGTGTVFSGLFCLCMGIPRFSQRDGPKPRFGAFVINIIIGCGQLFTVLFCLVGWGWSIWWGVIMVKIAKKYKKLKKIEERLEAQEKAAADAAAEQKRKDAEKGRS